MKIEINLPSDLSEVSLLQYQEFLKATENNTDEEFFINPMFLSTWIKY